MRYVNDGVAAPFQNAIKKQNRTINSSGKEKLREQTLSFKKMKT